MIRPHNANVFGRADAVLFVLAKSLSILWALFQGFVWDRSALE